MSPTPTATTTPTSHDQDPWSDPTLADQRERLLATLRGYGRVAVAYSGGVDSAVVAKAAHLALGDATVAVTAVSDSLAQGELEEAEALAQQIGIRHRVIRTEEFADPNYLRNDTNRCYFCKSELYGRLSGLIDQLGAEVIASGANLDDGGDHRPGMRAAGENDVRHPLQECGLTKADVRALARAWGLPTWDKPATPCLSSRIAYGEEVTPERVRMIDQAERWLRQRGLKTLRVRYHKGDMARVEVPTEELAGLVDPAVRTELVAAFRGLGFKYVTLDLEGFRSGSMNAVIPLESLQKPSAMKR
ncbi:MAG: ATP-dependent sacrificial sulfur transferase LarE [Isosphaeraceae bacterium]